MTRADALIEALRAQLALIVAGGELVVLGKTYTYRTDIGQREFLRRIAPLTESETLMMAVHPALPEWQPEAGEFGLDHYRLGALVEITARGRDAAALVGAAWDDLRQSVRALHQGLRAGRLARSCTVAPTEPTEGFREQLAGQRAAGLAALITIDYTTTPGEI